MTDVELIICVLSIMDVVTSVSVIREVDVMTVVDVEIAALISVKELNVQPNNVLLSTQ